MVVVVVVVVLVVDDDMVVLLLVFVVVDCCCVSNEPKKWNAMPSNSLSGPVLFDVAVFIARWIGRLC